MALGGGRWSPEPLSGCLGCPNAVVALRWVLLRPGARGRPQGSVLGPVLSSVIKDLTEGMEWTLRWSKLGGVADPPELGDTQTLPSPRGPGQGGEWVGRDLVGSGTRGDQPPAPVQWHQSRGDLLGSCSGEKDLGDTKLPMGGDQEDGSVSS